MCSNFKKIEESDSVRALFEFEESAICIDINKFVENRDILKLVSKFSDLGEYFSVNDCALIKNIISNSAYSMNTQRKILCILLTSRISRRNRKYLNHFGFFYIRNPDTCRLVKKGYQRSLDIVP